MGWDGHGYAHGLGLEPPTHTIQQHQQRQQHNNNTNARMHAVHLYSATITEHFRFNLFPGSYRLVYIRAIRIYHFLYEPHRTLVSVILICSHYLMGYWQCTLYLYT